jgi:hypothetical protein
MTKAEKIKQTLKETKERRKNLRPVVYQLKIQNLSKVREEKLNRVFLEANSLKQEALTSKSEGGAHFFSFFGGLENEVKPKRRPGLWKEGTV